MLFVICIYVPTLNKIYLLTYLLTYWLKKIYLLTYLLTYLLVNKVYCLLLYILHDLYRNDCNVMFTELYWPNLCFKIPHISNRHIYCDYLQKYICLNDMLLIYDRLITLH